MSAETFKAQAERLAAHLANKHGIKLKSSSMLEAVAALHGARDWNTLVAASTKLTSGPVAPVASPVVASAQDSPQDFLEAALQVHAPTLLLRATSREGWTNWSLQYEGTTGQHTSSLSPEVAKAFRGRLLAAAGLLVSDCRPGELRHGSFSYPSADGQVQVVVRTLGSPHGETLAAELRTPFALRRRLQSLPTVAPWVADFLRPRQAGLYIVAGITNSGADFTVDALATMAKDRTAVSSENFTKDLSLFSPALKFDLVTGELREKEGVMACRVLLGKGNLVLAQAHANSAASVVARLQQLGMPVEAMRKHLRGILFVKTIRKACQHCGGDGCAACSHQGKAGWAHLDENVLLSRPGDFDAFIEGRIEYRTARDQASELVKSGIVSSDEFVSLFGYPT